MENQQNEQIKIEVKDTTKESINYVSTEIKANEKTDISELVGMLQSGTSEPSNKPTTLYGQIKIDSANNKVYFFDAVIGDWVTIGAGVVQQYTSSISHVNTAGGSTSYTDTITSTFKPHTVIFFSEYHQGSNVYMSNGQAGVTAPTGGVSSWMQYNGGSYNSGVSANRIGYSGVGDTYVSTWNNDGVVLTTSLVGSNGNSATVNAQIILVG